MDGKLELPFTCHLCSVAEGDLLESTRVTDPQPGAKRKSLTNGSLSPVRKRSRPLRSARKRHKVVPTSTHSTPAPTDPPPEPVPWKPTPAPRTTIPAPRTTTPPIPAPRTTTPPIPAPRTTPPPIPAKQLGLQSAYQKDEATRTFIEKILALPYLPAEHIPPMWEKLHRQASEFPASPLKTNLLGLLDYVNNNWINTDRAWKPKNWSAFLQLVRTNNNVEGWHNMLNIRANKIGMGLYRLLYHLFTHTKDVSLQARLVSNHKVIKYHRRELESSREPYLSCGSTLWQRSY